MDNVELVLFKYGQYDGWFRIIIDTKIVGVIKLSKGMRSTLCIDILDIFKYNQRKGYGTSVINMLRKNYSIEGEYTVNSMPFYEKIGAKISRGHFYFKRIK